MFPPNHSLALPWCVFLAIGSQCVKKNTPGHFLEQCKLQWGPAPARVLPCEPVLSGACWPTGALLTPPLGEKGLRETVAAVWSPDLFPPATLISSTGRLGFWAHQHPQPQLRLHGHSREASILALAGVAGSPISTWVAGTAVQGHLTVSALEEESAMRTSGRARRVGVN